MLLDLKEVINKEKLAVEKQLALLDKQNRLIMKNNAIELDSCTENSIYKQWNSTAWDRKKKVLKDKNLMELVLI